MITKNNWYYSNMKERLDNPNLNFKVILNPYEFEKVNFATAAKNVAREIAEQYDNLYLSLSGGLDSEYLLRLFVGQDIKITPVIYHNYSNKIEVQYALDACEELKIKPVVFSPTDKELVEFYVSEIIKKVNGTHAIYSIFAMMAAKYVYEQQGVLITGNHLMGDQGDPIDQLVANDWDFFPDLIYDKLIHIDPLLYTPQIVYACFDNIKEDWAVHKAKIFNVKFRDKTQPSYSKKVGPLLSMLIGSRKFKPAHCYSIPFKQVFN